MTDKQGREVFVGSDGQIWTWANGQQVLSHSGHSRQWLTEHMEPGRDREVMLDAVVSRTSPDKSHFKSE